MENTVNSINNRGGNIEVWWVGARIIPGIIPDDGWLGPVLFEMP
jgi:hypothetical protein